MSRSSFLMTEAATKRGAWQLLTTLLQQVDITDPFSCTVPVTTVFPGDDCPDRNQLNQFIWALRGCGLRTIETDKNGQEIYSYFPLFATLSCDLNPYQIRAYFNPALLAEVQKAKQESQWVDATEQSTERKLQKLWPTIVSDLLL